MTDHDVTVRDTRPQAVSVAVEHATLDQHDLHDHHEEGPQPIGTLMVIGILLLVTIAFWMLVLGIQQARA